MPPVMSGSTRCQDDAHRMLRTDLLAPHTLPNSADMLPGVELYDDAAPHEWENPRPG